MKDNSVVAYCNIRRNGVLKWPTLNELYLKLFNADLPVWHNAQDDVQNTMKCFWKLNDNGVINVTDFMS